MGSSDMGGTDWKRGILFLPLTAPLSDNYLLIVRCKWSVDGADQRLNRWC